MDLSLDSVEQEFNNIIDLLPGDVKRAGTFFKGPTNLPVLEQVAEKSFSLDRRAKRFIATEPVWVRYITFLSGDIKKFKNSVGFSYVNLKGESVSKKLSLGENNSYVWINDVVVSFEIQSTAKLFKADLKKVSVCGFDLQELAKVSENSIRAFDLKGGIDKKLKEAKDEVEGLQNKISSMEQEELELSERIDASRVEFERISTSVREVEAELESVNSELAASQARLDAFRTQETNAQNNIEQLKQAVAGLDRKIAEERAELEKLTSDRSLISDEYRDYVKEGRSQSFWYLLFSVLPALVIILAVQQVYDSSEALLNRQFSSFSEVFSAFIQRIPLTMVLSVAVYFSWVLASGLLGRVFKIHNDRLTLARLLVIAKDTVYSSAQGLNIDDEVKLRERVVLKIELLKSHLARDLSPDFEYKGVLPKNDEQSGPTTDSQK